MRGEKQAAEAFQKAEHWSRTRNSEMTVVTQKSLETVEEAVETSPRRKIR